MVKKSDFENANEMPEINEKFIFDRILLPTEIELISQGYLPKEMDDKWFIYFENNKLYIHRSWTGFCIYILNINENGKLECIVNREDNQYLQKDINQDKIQLNAILDFLVETNKKEM